MDVLLLRMLEAKFLNIAESSCFATEDVTLTSLPRSTFLRATVWASVQTELFSDIVNLSKPRGQDE